jgi:hypothetical protein
MCRRKLFDLIKTYIREIYIKEDRREYMTTFRNEIFMSVYMVIRPESTDLPEIRRYDIKQFKDDVKIQSSWVARRNGKVINYMDMYDVAVDLQEFGNYAILDIGKTKDAPAYLKYPSGKYIIASKGGWSEQYYTDIKEIPYEKLPPHIKEREYNRNLIYKNRDTERYREELFKLNYRQNYITFKRIFIDDKLICVIEDQNIETTDFNNKKHVYYYVIWPDRSRETWENGAFFSYETQYSPEYPIDDLFPTTTALATTGLSGHTIQETLAQLRLLAN